MSRNLVLLSHRLISPQHFASGHFLRPKPLALALVATLVIGGCSADITRFDGQGYGLTDKSSATIPAQGMRRGEASRLGDTPPADAPAPGGAYVPPRANNTQTGNVRMSALPEPVSPLPQQTTPSQRAPSIAPRPIGPVAAAQAKPIAPGATIEVVQGDTLFGLAKKHAVPVNELMTVNQLTTPNLKPGQKLVLPASRSIARAPTPQKPIQRAAAPTRMAGLPADGGGASAAAPALSPPPSDWAGQHTVKPGDSLYAIARANKISLAQLQQVNGITEPTKVKPGTVLKVPGGPATASLSNTPPASAASQVAGVSAASETPRLVQSANKPVIINQQQAEPAPAPPQQVAAVDPVEPAEAKAEPKSKAAEGVASASGQKFRWPVKGRVIASYGPRSDSTHNDGVNIAVPMGTEVLAAEQGVVAYAGSELKGYGNLILLRHDNGWVTAYAHNEEILVKRGDKVKRGQAIAKAGKTGTVDQPQVHFELRQGQKPIDPTPHMEKM
jgi:murein DD-endopeptidase MepM/ murein hydrolase activator NlpD